MRSPLRSVLVSVAILACATPSASSPAAPPHEIRATDDAGLARAVTRLIDSGGVIRLVGDSYRKLVVRARPAGAAPLVIVADGTRVVEHVLLAGTERVTLRGLTISPLDLDASVEVRDSTAIEMDGLTVSAEGTGHSATILVSGGEGVSLRRSNVSHCGDRTSERVNCLRLCDRASRLVVEDTWFHDTLGSDFIHGRPGLGLIVRRNLFERALPCRMGGARCTHQDLIELFAGRWLRFESNYFGVYRNGGAQLYLTDEIDHVVIVNNVFVGTDARVPNYRARVAVIVGSRGAPRLPLHVEIANNTILTGARRRDGYAGSIRMNSHYRTLPRSLRPMLANNVIALLERRFPVCKALRDSQANLIVRGRRCTTDDRRGAAHLDRWGRPTGRSVLIIDRADPRIAPKFDVFGRRRDARPDVGAFEYFGEP